MRGDLLIEVLSDFPERFEVGSELDLVGIDGRRDRVCIRNSRPHNLGRIISIDRCSSRDDAEQLRAASLEIDRSATLPAPEGSYFYFELVGCRCVDGEMGDLGAVVEIIEDGGGILLRVVDGDRELMVPFVESFVDRVDVAAGVIELSLPPGFIEICASKS